MDFTAIDFETASRRQDSACQLAAVVVRGGQIVDSAAWLIRPEPCFFSRTNIQIHGITPDRVRDRPVFGELWPEISAKLGGDCLVAHNASFDLGVLLACLRAHHQSVPELHFTCTRAIARRTWPGRQRYGLKPLADWLGVRFQHHDALEDSIACAKLLLAAGIDRGSKSVAALEGQLRLSRGAAGDWGYRGPGRVGVRRTARQPAASEKRPSGVPAGAPSAEVSSSAKDSCGGDAAVAAAHRLDLQRLLVRAEFIRPLSGRRVAFTGRLQQLGREEAEQLSGRLGAECQASVTRRTDILVVGGRDQRTRASGRTKSVKEEAAERIRAAGGSIRIMNEEEFLGLVVASGEARCSR